MQRRPKAFHIVVVKVTIDETLTDTPKNKNQTIRDIDIDLKWNPPVQRRTVV